MPTNSTQLELERWQRLNALLEKALALNEVTRSDWVQSMCAANPDLADALNRMMLRQKVETDDFLIKPVPLRNIVRDAAGCDDAAGSHIGPYRLVAKVGAGGMGTVWLAERSDNSVKRRVAVKLPISRWVPGLASRMSRERDILASLEHPNIARLYDAGVTDTGRPYLALEYVEGEAIDVYCKNRSLDVARRLELFLQVAQAVAYAHRRLVVHRDLKPSNILVTSGGDVRLLDFGVAKLLQSDKVGDGQSQEYSNSAVDSGQSSEQRALLTGKALTVDYASPEQLSGEAVSVATDVYSSGIVLFELLTGVRPHARTRDGSTADVKAPYTFASPRASDLASSPVARQLRGDLDAILAKAMQERPEERYSSMEAFSADICRFLRCEPVSACKDSNLYRARKFVARNKGKVASGFVAALCVILATSVALWQASVAREEAARAQAVKKFIASIFSSVTPRTGIGGEVTAADLLSAAIPRVEKEFSTQPAIAAELGVMIAEAFDELGETEKKVLPLNAAITRAEKAFGASHEITIRGKLARAESLSVQDPSQAVSLLGELLPLAVSQVAKHPELTFRALREKSFAHARLGQEQASIEALNQAIEIGERHLGVADERTLFAIGLLSNTYGSFGNKSKQLQVAEEGMRRAELAFSRERPHVVLTAIERWYADALRVNGRPAESVAVLQRVLLDQRKLDVAETKRVRHAKFFLARALDASGRSDLALPMMKDALSDAERQESDYAEDRHIYLNTYAFMLNNARLGDEGLNFQRKANDVLANTPADADWFRPRYSLNTARSQSLLGYATEADATLRSLEADSKIDNDLRLSATISRALNARLRGDQKTAISLLTHLVEPSQFATLTASMQASVLSLLGISYLDVRDYARAKPLLDRCRRFYEVAQINLSTRASECLVGTARLLVREARFLESEAMLSKLASDWGAINAGSGWQGEALYWLSFAQSKRGDTLSAKRSLENAISMLLRSKLPVHQALATKVPSM